VDNIKQYAPTNESDFELKKTDQKYIFVEGQGSYLDVGWPVKYVTVPYLQVKWCVSYQINMGCDLPSIF